MSENHARQQACAQMESIAEMVAALDVDYDRLEHLRDKFDALGGCEKHAAELGKSEWSSDVTAHVGNDLIYAYDVGRELAELESDADECEDLDDAQQRIHEDPLSIEYRSGWSSDPHSLEPDEFCVLLCTGGPAVRIVGELGEHGAIHRAWLEYQDWGTPWTHYYGADTSALIRYCETLGIGLF